MPCCCCCALQFWLIQNTCNTRLARRTSRSCKRRHGSNSSRNTEMPIKRRLRVDVFVRLYNIFIFWVLGFYIDLPASVTRTNTHIYLRVRLVDGLLTSCAFCSFLRHIAVLPLRVAHFNCPVRGIGCYVVVAAFIVVAVGLQTLTVLLSFTLLCVCVCLQFFFVLFYMFLLLCLWLCACVCNIFIHIYQIWHHSSHNLWAFATHTAQARQALQECCRLWHFTFCAKHFFCAPFGIHINRQCIKHGELIF